MSQSRVQGVIHSQDTRNRKLSNVHFQIVTKSLTSHNIIGSKCYNKITPNVLNCPTEMIEQKLHDWFTDYTFHSLGDVFKFSSNPITL